MKYLLTLVFLLLALRLAWSDDVISLNDKPMVKLTEEQSQEIISAYCPEFLMEIVNHGKPTEEKITQMQCAISFVMEEINNKVLETRREKLMKEISTKITEQLDTTPVLTIAEP
jgi:hypothetical protein